MQKVLIGWLFGAVGQRALLVIIASMLENLRPYAAQTKNELDDKILDALIDAVRGEAARRAEG